MSTVLADLGGTNLRLSKDGGRSIETFKIAEYDSFDSILHTFAPDASALYLASAITPLDGIIEDKRFSKDSHWRIDLNALGLQKITVLNDLEAAAYGLAILPLDQTRLLLSPSEPQRHFESPPKLLIGIGTGIGHAFLYERAGEKPFVQRSHGGHVPAFAITQPQQEIIALLAAKHTLDRDFIMENVIGGKGLWALSDMIGREQAVAMFWEFLGLYANMLVSLCGAYGGVYLCGGIMDDMVEDNTIDAQRFKKFFIRPMVESVVESLSSVPVHYCKDINLPILGLSVFAGNRS